MHSPAGLLRRAAVVTAAAAAVVVTLSACQGQSGPHQQPTSAPDPPTSASATTHAAHPSPSPSKRPTAAQLRAQVSTKVKLLKAGQPKGSISVAALNTSTGARYSAGATSGMWTASVYKLFVLETLLVENGGPLTGSEASEAIPMIEQSDNVAGYALFLAAGGNSGLADGAQRLGLTHTVPGVSDPTFTTTSAMDLLTLLNNLVHPGPLTKAARDYALGLMRNVESDQRWGVGVVADKGSTFANKNGWLSVDNSNGPGEDDNGLWAVNSVGVLTVHGQQVLMAVMTRHQSSFQTGVNLVQRLARDIEPAVAR